MKKINNIPKLRSFSDTGVCPDCGGVTTSDVRFDNACSECDYVETYYPDANPL